MSKVTGKWRPLVTSCIHAYKRTINIDTLTALSPFSTSYLRMKFSQSSWLDWVPF